MSVSNSKSITAQDYNSLQSRISNILGGGSGNFGYGNSVTSSVVDEIIDKTIPDGDSVLASQLNNLLDDFNVVYDHQNGSNIPINAFDIGDIIGADESASDIIYNTDGTFDFVNEDASKGFNDFYSYINELENNRFQIAPTQQQIQTLASEIRTSSWNGTIDCEFTLNFSTADSRRYFFNAGGQIRLQGIVTNVSSQRGTFWNDLIENPGEIQFGYNYTQNTGSTSGISFPNGIIGNYDLTTSYQTILRKDANSGIYSDSYWEIQGRENSSSEIVLRVILRNDGPESDSDAGSPGSISGGITESVRADIEFELSTRRANGSVVVSNPLVTITDSL